MHHSWSKDRGALDWQGVRSYHKSKGWRDVGYQLCVELVDWQYEILFGRMLDDSGAHCYQQAMNKKSIGICFIGNFDLAPPAKQQWDLGVKLVKSLTTILDIPKENVLPHRDFAKYKTCPGNFFDMDKFRGQL